MLCPGTSDVNLFRYCQGVIDFDAQIPDGAFNLGMTEQELDGSQVARPPVDQVAFVRRSECVPKLRGSKPTLAIHPARSRAYCRVVKLTLNPRRLVNR